MQVLDARNDMIAVAWRGSTDRGSVVVFNATACITRHGIFYLKDATQTGGASVLYPARFWRLRPLALRA